MQPMKCPVHTSVHIIGGKWKPGILYCLRDGTFRFGELKRQMPWISETVLIRQLKELEKDGIILRKDYREVPPRVDYSLTDYGLSVLPVLEVMAQWGAQHIEREDLGMNS